MSKYILNGKIYNTDTATKIIEYSQSIEHKGLFLTTYPRYNNTLYKTKKGHFFVHIGKYMGQTDVSYQNKDYIKLVTEDEVKQILEELNAVEKYLEIFGTIEEE